MNDADSDPTLVWRFRTQQETSTGLVDALTQVTITVQQGCPIKVSELRAARDLLERDETYYPNSEQILGIPVKGNRTKRLVPPTVRVRLQEKYDQAYRGLLESDLIATQVTTDMSLLGSEAGRDSQTIHVSAESRNPEGRDRDLQSERAAYMMKGIKDTNFSFKLTDEGAVAFFQRQLRLGSGADEINEAYGKLAAITRLMSTNTIPLHPEPDQRQPALRRRTWL